MWRSPARAKGWKAGAEGFEPSGVLPPLVFKTSAFVRSAMPPQRSCGEDYTIFGPNIYRRAYGHLSGGAQYLVVSFGGDTNRGMKKRLREPVSGLTHLVGALLALVASVVLLTKVAGRVDQLVAFGIFGLSLVVLYAASALYHLLPVSPSATARLRRLDHMTIFILIAGTYTPICVLALGGGWRGGVVGFIWAVG